ncbi:hypothetical protein RI367_000623 [Sorochytrium milnesiophthora]
MATLRRWSGNGAPPSFATTAGHRYATAADKNSDDADYSSHSDSGSDDKVLTAHNPLNQLLLHHIEGLQSARLDSSFRNLLQRLALLSMSLNEHLHHGSDSQAVETSDNQIAVLTAIITLASKLEAVSGELTVLDPNRSSSSSSSSHNSRRGSASDIFASTMSDRSTSPTPQRTRPAASRPFAHSSTTTNLSPTTSDSAYASSETLLHSSSTASLASQPEMRSPTRSLNTRSSAENLVARPAPQLHVLPTTSAQTRRPALSSFAYDRRPKSTIPINSAAPSPTIPPRRPSLSSSAPDTPVNTSSTTPTSVRPGLLSRQPEHLATPSRTLVKSRSMNHIPAVAAKPSTLSSTRSPFASMRPSQSATLQETPRVQPAVTPARSASHFNLSALADALPRAAESPRFLDAHTATPRASTLVNKQLFPQPKQTDLPSQHLMAGSVAHRNASPFAQLPARVVRPSVVPAATASPPRPRSLAFAPVAMSSPGRGDVSASPSMLGDDLFPAVGDAGDLVDVTFDLAGELSDIEP